MNKIINVNLAGRLLAIDEEAYNQLTVYLNWLKQYFSKEKGGSEIYSDMEDRIAELFDDKIRKGGTSINNEDVQSVIKIMGSPEQIAMETADEFAEMEIPQPQQEQHQNTTNKANYSGKKLQRNGRDKILGGVCSGIADYINVDVSIVRVVMLVISLFYGTGFLLYILLWAILPVSYEAPAQLKKRLYRDEDQKVLGGVCKGLSAYANMPVSWVRIIFVSPFIGAALFNIINDNDLAQFSQAAIPTMTLLYIVLWAILPKAQTLTQKMELRGEKLDIQNLSTALKNENQQSNRAQGSSNTNFGIVLAKIIGFGALFFIVGILLYVLFIVCQALLGVLFGVGDIDYLNYAISQAIFEHHWQRNLFYIAAIGSVMLPMVMLLRWIFNLMRKNRKPNKAISYSLGTAWLLSIFALFYIGGEVLGDFKKEFKTVEVLNMQQPKDTLVITQIVQNLNDANPKAADFDFIKNDQDGKLQFAAMSVKVVPSIDSLYHINLIRQSNGATVARAQQFASAIVFHYKQDSGVLQLPKYISLGNQKLYRGQLLTTEIQVPKGKIFKMGNIPNSFSRSWQITSVSKSYNIKFRGEQLWQPNTYYKMGEDGSITALP